MTLVEALKDPAVLDAVATDGAVIVKEEVVAKKGVRAAVLKMGFKTVQNLKPGIIESMLRKLLPKFAPKVDPHWERAVSGGDPRAYFATHAGEIADSLLEVTDERAKQVSNAVLLRVYTGLRGQAKRYTEESVPRLPDLIEKHVS